MVTKRQGLRPRAQRKAKKGPAHSTELLLDLAIAAHEKALSSVDPADAIEARLLDAAWLVAWRRRRGSVKDVDGKKLNALTKAVVAYLGTRDDDTERWTGSDLPPMSYKDRSGRVKKLCALAGEARAYCARTPRSAPSAANPKPTPPAQVVASSLIVSAIKLGLCVNMGRRVDAKRQAILVEKLEQDAPNHVIASHVMQAVGVSRTDADDWARAPARG